MNLANFAQFQAPAAPAPHPAQIRFPDLPAILPTPGTQPGPFSEEMLYLTQGKSLPSEGTWEAKTSAKSSLRLH
ncbi:hypothetical protein RSK20926_12254 [Roseobacter sp. SK209-2-6]|nr:hypothetical protein RSK20926_12254 [Roseobacter sp. SK209-2-6]